MSPQTCPDADYSNLQKTEDHSNVRISLKSQSSRLRLMVAQKSTRISVVIPLFNKGSHVGAAIESVLAQTRPANEVLVIDDGSTDGSARVAEAFGDKVKIISQSNRGVSAARNIGTEIAGGETIAFLDADDLWKPQFLEKVVGLLERFPNACAAGCAYEYLRPGAQITKLWFAAFTHDFREGPINYFASMAGGGAPPLHSSTTVARRSVLKEVGGFPVGQRWGEDHDTWARLAMVGDIAVTTEVLVTVNVAADNRASESPDPRPQLPTTFTVARALSTTMDPTRRSILRKYLKKVALNSPMANLRHGHLAIARSQLLESREWTGFSFRWFLLLTCSYLPMPLVNLARIVRKPIALRQGNY
jgi:glycosyltransferase involved in cell wall biosynthesis